MAVKLKDAIAARSKEFFQALYTDYRKQLDQNITILDLSYEALKVNVYIGNKLSKREEKLYDYVYGLILETVREAIPKNRTYPNISAVPDNYFLGKQPYPILIDNLPSFFIVGKSFDAIRSIVSSKISADPRLTRTRFGSIKTYDPSKEWGKRHGFRSKVDIGHIPGEDSDNLTSPLEQKILNIANTAKTLGNVSAEEAANRALQRLYNIQAEISYDFKNTSPEAIAAARSKLGSGYIVVTLHTQRKNNLFSREELQIFTQLVRDIATSLDITDISGSNTIKQDIAESLVNILLNKSKPKSHAPQKGTLGKKSLNLTPPKVKKASGIKIPKLRDKQTGQFTNPANLQALLNSALTEQIRKNMGTGSRKDVLNYRSGRFANSAKVESVSVSREGMITAFYSYMKYPYQTFEPGFRQGSPKTRDPKLLISKSIREIAANLVGNKLRAVRL